MDTLKHFGNKIKHFRKIKNISQEELAELSDLHRTYIGGIERGERNVSLINIEKLAKALNIQIKDLFDDE
ncbi:MAG: transcriptional regulator [Spirochaetes bacterium GWD1_27_9]|nr:MAG: transcriptional regulator [Spirochaetes bacterium GWB1_27_13]OHD26791.1 MAG: transcriptional regulator [Spirochaetes bacterium GWC1_27_15]OHD33611.1 MAG: transcriptional regulator [Spirochaetes bacterium GWD1_27_9]